MKKPRMKAPTSGPLQPAACGGSKPQVFTLLHIDDDPNDTELFQAAARRAKVQFAVQNVTDAEQAMAYLSGRGRYADRRSFPLPSLVLLDLKMPRATGFDVLRWIRNHPEVGSLPVVIFSGSELQDDIQQAYAGGADSYLVKPIGFNALIELVTKLNASWVAGQSSRAASLSLPDSASGWQAPSSWMGGGGGSGACV
jgi:CheY-like chemotaxis protein